jgi:hypothetical protein
MFDGGIFWMIMGALFVLLGVGASIWAKDLGLIMTKTKWTLSIVWYLLLLLTVAAPMTALAENESVAAFRMMLVLIVITVITGVALLRYLTYKPKVK